MQPLFSFGYGGCLQECVCVCVCVCVWSTRTKFNRCSPGASHNKCNLTTPPCFPNVLSARLTFNRSLSPEQGAPSEEQMSEGGGQGLRAQLNVSLVCQFALIPQEVTRDHHWPWLSTLLRNLWRTFKICHLPLCPLSCSLDTAGFVGQGSQLSHPTLY